MSRVPPDERGAVLGREAYCIAGGDLACRDHFGIDAAVGVIEVFQERAWDCQIADAGVRIDVGGGAALYSLDHLRPRSLSDGDRLVEQVEFAPGSTLDEIRSRTEASFRVSNAL